MRAANAKGTARLLAVQALYQMDVGGTTLPETLAQFEAFRMAGDPDAGAYRPVDQGYFRHLVSGVVSEQKKLDPAIHSSLPSTWPLTRLDRLFRAILRVATYELAHHADVPTPVVINEYLDVTRAFYDDTEVRLANGVLSALASKLRRQTIKKTG
ncbi:MAG: transcription antitermination factor NusB [Pseudomonadota bacterium]